MRLRSRPSSVHRTGRVIVLMQGPYDSRGKKVNEVNMYDVFGRHSTQLNKILRLKTLPKPRMVKQLMRSSDVLAKF